MVNVPAVSTPDSRFVLEVMDHAGNFVAQVPYRNLQGETFLSSGGNIKPHALRGEIPYHGYGITPAMFYPGSHELWLRDMQNLTAAQPNVLFAGPVVDATAGSGTGVIAFSAQDPFYYMAKRLLLTSKTYAAQPADMLVDLITYLNSVRSTNLSSNKVTSNATTHNLTLPALDLIVLADLVDQMCSIGDGTDVYWRSSYSGSAGVHALQIYGGKKAPAAGTKAWEYGGALKSYSLQVNAAGMSNDLRVRGQGNLVGHATDATSQANYNALYQTVDSGSSLSAQASLDASAATQIKNTKNPILVPTVVVKGYDPVADFDLGDQFTLVIDDDWAQYNAVIRVVGWQMTIGAGDRVTTNIYVNNLDEVT
jgi:hypothetical protein